MSLTFWVNALTIRPGTSNIQPKGQIHPTEPCHPTNTAPGAAGKLGAERAGVGLSS